MDIRLMTVKKNKVDFTIKNGNRAKHSNSQSVSIKTQGL